MFSNSDDGNIIVSDARNGGTLAKLNHNECIYGMALTQDETRLISCSESGKMFFWSTETFEKMKEMVTEGSIKCISMVPNSDYMITGDDFFRVIIWDLTNVTQITIFRAHKSAV